MYLLLFFKFNITSQQKNKNTTDENKHKNEHLGESSTGSQVTWGKEILIFCIVKTEGLESVH